MEFVDLYIDSRIPKGAKQSHHNLAPSHPLITWYESREDSCIFIAWGFWSQKILKTPSLKIRAFNLKIVPFERSCLSILGRHLLKRIWSQSLLSLPWAQLNKFQMLHPILLTMLNILQWLPILQSHLSLLHHIPRLLSSWYYKAQPEVPMCNWSYPHWDKSIKMAF